MIATAPAPLGGETTVIALDAHAAAMGRFPALDLAASGTMRPELLVGDAGAEAIAKARAETRRRVGRRRRPRASRGCVERARGGAASRRWPPPLTHRRLPPDARSTARARTLARRVGDPAPGRLGRELDRLAVALGLDVAERVRGLVEGDVELALLDPLVEPGGAEHEPPQPVHERAIGGADELGPAVVDVLAERRGGVDDLAVDRQVDEVLELGVLERGGRRSRASGRLLDALAEVALVEGEAKLPVLEDVVLAGVVVAAANLNP